MLCAFLANRSTGTIVTYFNMGRNDMAVCDLNGRIDGFLLAIDQALHKQLLLMDAVWDQECTHIKSTRQQQK